MKVLEHGIDYLRHLSVEASLTFVGCDEIGSSDVSCKVWDILENFGYKRHSEEVPKNEFVLVRMMLQDDIRDTMEIYRTN